MATLTAQQIIRTGNGLEPTFASVAAADKFANEPGRIFAFIKNANAGTLTVTGDVKGQVDGLDVADPTFTYLTTEERMIGPFPESWEDTDGNINLAFDIQSSVTIAILRL